MFIRSIDTDSATSTARWSCKALACSRHAGVRWLMLVLGVAGVTLLVLLLMDLIDRKQELGHINGLRSSKAVFTHTTAFPTLTLHCDDQHDFAYVRMTDLYPAKEGWTLCALLREAVLANMTCGHVATWSELIDAHGVCTTHDLLSSAVATLEINCGGAYAVPLSAGVVVPHCDALNTSNTYVSPTEPEFVYDLCFAMHSIAKSNATCGQTTALQTLVIAMTSTNCSSLPLKTVAENTLTKLACQDFVPSFDATEGGRVRSQ